MSPVRLGGFALAAAAVILSVGLASQWRTRHLEPVGETGVTRSATIRVETPLDHLAAAPAEIRWQAVEGAGAYEILIAEVDRTVVFHKNFTTPVLPVPLELGSLLVPGKSLTLKITARDAAGKELATSGPLSLRVELDH